MEQKHRNDRLKTSGKFDLQLAGLNTEELNQISDLLGYLGFAPRVSSLDDAALHTGEGKDTSANTMIPAIRREVETIKLRREKLLLSQQLSRITHYDELTRLPNQRHLLEALSKGIAEQPDRRIVVAHIYFDQLTMYSDMLGSELGGRLIRAVASRLREISDSLQVARLGHNDFALLFDCRGNSCDECSQIAHRINAYYASPFNFDGRELFIETTTGISCYPCHGSQAAGLLRNAKYAMQQAYRMQLPYQLFNLEIEREITERINIRHRLRGAVNRNEFTLFYQPKVDCRNNTINSVEVLIRWNDQQLGNVSPALFIPIAEETGDIIPIGIWVLHQACQQGATWVSEGLLNGRMAVNVSMRQLRDTSFVQTVESILQFSGMPAEKLELEITESEIMHDGEMAITMLKQLQAMGIKITIDDFGTGHSSLSYLKRLPISTLKIDRSFVSDLEASHDSRTIIRSIITLAHSMQLSVVAEGVETQAQYDFLRSEACEEVQGYLFSKPVAADELERLLWNDGQRHRPNQRLHLVE